MLKGLTTSGAGAVLLAGAGALALAVTPAAGQASFKAIGASLFGENEVGHDGAGEDAGGDFEGMIDHEAGTLCYYLEVRGLGNVTAAHLHKGGTASNGPPVVTLQLASDDEVCVDGEADLLRDIARNSRNYYVNVHTEAFPQGAVRGQLGS